MLHVGGVQAAEIAAPPRFERAVMELLPVVFDALEKFATSGFDEVQTRGGLASVTPTVAWIAFEPPLSIVNEFPEPPTTWSRISLTRQVTKGVVSGVLVVPETLAKSWVIPGVLAVT